ncbi:insulin-degrading enzyme [Thecamonas trahens ATCC 50062]|uniref:Insulin-degrading enzyme n=1 Tax=Thecamonas trahens ATCC 50062 TaxID=461836 RepID=A0A0L0DIM3_THETB|nr:insulin-degrading enzyme [Thecamonas trahens ATCC 50062]KNC52137.1 insulin-degrading enzyme [Thecamonas trahens ATCC 50062]|eukprot:XP_013762141.1 insulin-degrading enzyme [Thecamonas trahens ATCC 50062]
MADSLPPRRLLGVAKGPEEHPASRIPGATPLVTPRTFPADKGEYAAFELSNGLQVIAVSRPGTKMGAAAMNVNVGYFSDPQAVPGLAHFCEHMLFLGTAKYPDESYYAGLVASRAGEENASTSRENTEYYFGVDADHMIEVLDVFAQFFVAPKFSASATARELHAIDEEFNEEYVDDDIRAVQVVKACTGSTHPYSAFDCGNVVSLEEVPAATGVDVRAELMAFHAKWYSANLMRLVVYGAEPLPVLVDAIAASFADVPNMHTPPPRFDPALLAPDAPQHQRPLLLSVATLKSMYTLEVIWQWPSVRGLNDTKPHELIGHLVGHEGEGSIYAALSARGWLKSLSAGVDTETADFCFFSVEMELTSLGFAHVFDVVAALYAYLALLRHAHPLPSWIWDEKVSLDATQFAHKSEVRAVKWVRSLAEAMHELPIDAVISGPYEYAPAFDPDGLATLLDALIPENSIILCKAKDLPAAYGPNASAAWPAVFAAPLASHEPWYDVDYAAISLPTAAPDVVASWASASAVDAAASWDLALPQPNAFIATDFALCEPEASPPPLPPPARPLPTPADPLPPILAAAESGEVLDTAPPSLLVWRTGWEVWHKTDTEFRVPKGLIKLRLRLPLATISPHAAVCMRLWMALLADALISIVYPASVAGLSFSLSHVTEGIAVSVSGYSHKLFDLLSVLVEAIANEELSKGRFVMFREIIGRSLANAGLGEPLPLARNLHDIAISSFKWEITEYRRALASLTYDSFAAFVTSVRTSSAAATLYVHGNFTASRARTESARIASLLDNFVPLPRSCFPAFRSPLLAAGPAGPWVLERLSPDPVNIQSAVMNVYEVSVQSQEANAFVDLLVQLLDERFFTKLRTEQQLGYTVSVGVSGAGRVSRLRFSVQGSAASAPEVDAAIEAFLADFLGNVLPNLTQDELETNLASLAALTLKKKTSLVAAGARVWGELSSLEYLFDRPHVEVAHLAAITRSSLLAFATKVLDPASPLRRKLSVRVHAAASSVGPPPPPGVDPATGKPYIVIDDPLAFRAAATLAPASDKLPTWFIVPHVTELDHPDDAWNAMLASENGHASAYSGSDSGSDSGSSDDDS